LARILGRAFLIRHGLLVVRDELSVRRILKTLTFSHISVRPRHPQADTEAQETHYKNFADLVTSVFLMAREASRSIYGGRTRPPSPNKAA
jgi:hypothetical protein